MPSSVASERCVGSLCPRTSRPLSMSAASASTMRMNSGPCHSESVGTQPIQLAYLSLIVSIHSRTVWTCPKSRNSAMTQPVSLAQAAWRGFTMRCPNCGKGHLFRSFLKVVDHCEVCEEDYTPQRADD